MQSEINIQSYPNFLNKQEHDYVVARTLKGNAWEFNGVSEDEHALNFWFMNLINDVFFTDYMFNKIKTTTKKDFKILRVYANGQTYGLSGSYHQDITAPIPTNESAYKTLLYYVNPIWESKWGGSTLFCHNEEIYTQTFIPNNAILFDSTIHHVGLEPTRHCNNLRVTVAFKFQEKTNV